MFKIIFGILFVALSVRGNPMTECDVYQKTWNVIDYYNKADLSVDENFFPTVDPPLFSDDVVIHMGMMRATPSEWLGAYADVDIRRMQANPQNIDCSPWEWCHIQLMTTYYGAGVGSVSQRQFWTFVFDEDCRVAKYIILMEARDNDILSQALAKGPTTEL